MRFGGNETFPVRTGWLSKGLMLVSHNMINTFDHIEVADSLGVGRNMSKSIGHWLCASGLVYRKSRSGPNCLTPIGELILQRDPFFQHATTWWALHANIVTQKKSAAVWNWYFNEFKNERFERRICFDEFVRSLAKNGQRLPSERTIIRDLTCMLQSYANPLPAAKDDPEDATDCPFRHLGLLVYHKDSAYFERRFAERQITPELLGYVMCNKVGEARQEVIELAFTSALISSQSPGRIFSLNADGLATLVDKAQSILGKDLVRSYLLGGERMIAVACKSPLDWLTGYYDRMGV